jgi:hypothetical protein
MRAVLKLERIGDNRLAFQRAKEQGKVRRNAQQQDFDWHHKRAWVARIVGLDDVYGLQREFIRGMTDYGEANSTGSRGIFEYYPLKDGIYEVSEPISWKHCERYFCRVEGEDITKIDFKEVYNALTLVIPEEELNG